MFVRKIQIVLLVILMYASKIGVLALPSPLQYTNESYHHKHILGPEGDYTLEWKVNWEKKSIAFNVSAKCEGYIGLGLSKTGSLAGSDFVIGGIDSNGRPYFSDMHGIANGTLQEDYRNDWILLSAQRGWGRIYLNFSRPFDTCDEDDYQISDSLVHVIWAYGETDEITLFSPYHGNQTFYLLDPDTTTETANNAYRQIGPHSNLYLMQSWRPLTRQKVSINANSQMCSIIKGPQLSNKHYIVGGGAYLPFEEDRASVRQIILSRCMPPQGRDAVPTFDPLIKREGQECNSFQNSSLIPKHLCTEIIFVWGYGGKPFYFPEEVGIPIGLSQDEYYMMEVHYYNPENLQNLTVKAGLELPFHPRPRVWESGIQMINYGLYGVFTIPPRSPSFNVYGHCSSQCTTAMLPKEGFEVLAVLLQMRSLGKHIRLRHFRGTAELPWIINDDNYQSSFQQIRSLQKSVTVLPGDHLTLQCTYDSSTILNTTFSGFSNDQELCVAYLIVNKRVMSAWCSSEYSVENQLQYLGAQNFSRAILTDKNAQWSPSARAALQREMLHGLQTSSCPSHTQLSNSTRPRRLPTLLNRNRKLSNTGSSVSVASLHTPFATNVVAIPNIPVEYRPSSECQRNNVLANNFRFHRNTVAGKFKTQATTISTPTNPPVDQKFFPKIATSRYRRLNRQR